MIAETYMKIYNLCGTQSLNNYVPVFRKMKEIGPLSPSILGIRWCNML